MPVLMFRSWSLNEICIQINSFFVNEAHFNSGVRLLLKLYCVIVIKHVAFFTICAKLTITFTFTSLLLNFNTSVSACGCGFRI